MAQTKPPGRGLRVSGMIMTIVGAVIMIGSVVIGSLMADSGIGGEIDKVRDAVIVPGAGSVELEGNSQYQIFREVGAPMPTCAVLDPNGATASDSHARPGSITTGGRSWTSVEGFRTSVAGAYSVDCGGDEVLVAAPMSVGGIFAGLGGILLAIFGGIAGGCLLVVGLILYFAGRSKGRRAQQSPYPGGGPGQPYAQYPPGRHPQGQYPPGWNPYGQNPMSVSPAAQRYPHEPPSPGRRYQPPGPGA